MSRVTSNYKLNLFKIFWIVWGYRWLTVCITSITVILTYFVSLKKEPFEQIYKAITTIAPITQFEELKYNQFNLFIKSNYNVSLNELIKNTDIQEIGKFLVRTKDLNFGLTIQEIDRFYLLDLFADAIKEGSVLNDAIKKFNIIDKKLYMDDESYDKEVKRFVSKIKIYPSTDKNTPMDLNLEVKISDVKKWENLLLYISEPLNLKVKSTLDDVIKKKVRFVENSKKDLIEDLNLFSESKIEAYEKENLKRIAFLQEQKELAKILNIKKFNTNATNNNQNNSISNYDLFLLSKEVDGMPYYIRGYEMIDAEIELLKKRLRTDPKNYLSIVFEIDNLTKRIAKDRTNERLKKILFNTPIEKEGFKAARILSLSTKYQKLRVSELPLRSQLILSGFIGLILSIFTALFINKLNKNKI